MLSSQEIDDYRVFAIVNGDIGNAIDSADHYGQTLVQFNFARKYYVLIMDDEVFCFPTSQDCRHMADFLEYVQREVYHIL